MSIIFKMLKYLKNYSNLIKMYSIVALVIILVMQSVYLINYKSLCKEETKALQEELIVLKEQIETIKYDQNKVITEKETQINELKDEVSALEDSVFGLVDITFSSSSYTEARLLWNYLRDLGLNKYVCAGIIGNIMAEVGGQTLDLSRWQKYSDDNPDSPESYGICQWRGSRKVRLLSEFGSTFEDQLRFLAVELSEIFKEGDPFYDIQDEKEAALCFAKRFERCSSKYYSVRQINATTALKYFAGE